jgi:hypothetical protein
LIPSKIREFSFLLPLTYYGAHSLLKVIGAVSIVKRQPNDEAADSHPSNVHVWNV